MLRRSKKGSGGGAAPVEGAKVLVVNDHDPARELIVRFLDRAGFEVEHSHSADDALVKIGLADPRFHCVLIDLAEAGTSESVRLLERIRSDDDREVARTRVIITTDVDQNRVFSWQSGVDGFLVRPHHANDLLALITDALGRDDEERARFRAEQLKRSGEATRAGD